jgi:hypothetical protein
LWPAAFVAANSINAPPNSIKQPVTNSQIVLLQYADIMVRDKSGLLGIQSQHLLQCFEILEQPIAILMGSAERLPLPIAQNIATAILLYLRLFKFIMDPKQTLYDPKDCGADLLKFVLRMSPLLFIDLQSY